MLTINVSVPNDGLGDFLRASFVKVNTNFIETTDSLSLKAPISNPAFLGAPTAPTPTSSANNTQIATTSFVKGAINTALVGFTAPSNLEYIKVPVTSWARDTKSQINSTISVGTIVNIQLHIVSKVNANGYSIGESFQISPIHVNSSGQTEGISIVFSSVLPTSFDLNIGQKIIIASPRGVGSTSGTFEITNTSQWDLVAMIFFYGTS